MAFWSGIARSRSVFLIPLRIRGRPDPIRHGRWPISSIAPSQLARQSGRNLSGFNSPPLGALIFAVVFGFDTPRLAAGLFIVPKHNPVILGTCHRFCATRRTACEALELAGPQCVAVGPGYNADRTAEAEGKQPTVFR